MNKEPEALNYLVNLAVVGNKENHRGKIFESEEIIIKLINRNQPVKLLKEKKYLHDEWYMMFGKCPVCNHYNPFTSNYCSNCGQALERTEKGELYD